MDNKSEEAAVLMENLTQELKRGTLVLAVLTCAREPRYGYALVTLLQEKGVDIEQNTLYPLLRRLEKQGILESTWDTSESRPRKYYQISPEGVKLTEALTREWKKMNTVITALIEEEKNENH